MSQQDTPKGRLMSLPRPSECQALFSLAMGWMTRHGLLMAGPTSVKTVIVASTLSFTYQRHCTLPGEKILNIIG